MDEAHTFEPESLEVLFDSAQECISCDLPLAVVIAGTPGLVPNMRRCKATYVERSEILRFNTLTQEEAKEALEVPAREAGRPIEDAALECLLDWSDNYPFFIQMAGKHAWNASAARDGKEITFGDAQSGLAEAELIRNDFYEKRYEEIRDLKVNDLWIVDLAVQISELVAIEDNRFDRGRLAERLANINGGMDYDQAVGIVDVLLARGCLWRNQGVIEPGITSLCDFVKHKRAIT